MKEEIKDYINLVSKNNSFIERRQIVQYMRDKYTGKEASIEGQVNRLLRDMCDTGILERAGTGKYNFVK